MILIPTFIFTEIEEWSLVDAFYFSFTTLSTVGFGDLVPREEPPLTLGECFIIIYHICVVQARFY